MILKNMPWRVVIFQKNLKFFKNQSLEQTKQNKQIKKSEWSEVSEAERWDLHGYKKLEEGQEIKNGSKGRPHKSNTNQSETNF